MSPLLAQADMPKNAIDVAIGGKADMGWCTHMSAYDPKRTFIATTGLPIKKDDSLPIDGICLTVT